MDALERILSAKRIEDDGERLLADLIADVAAAGGVALVDDLLAAGHPRAVIAAALEPEGVDKRTRPWLRCGVVNGLDIVWATTKAWSQAGQPNRREAPPGSRTARHRTAPALMNRWVEQKGAQVRDRGILLSLDRGPTLRQVTEEMTQRAWALVRQGGTLGQQASLLLTRPVPDALLVESWPADERAVQWRDHQLYPHLGCEDRPGGELAVAIEIQFSDAASALISQKVRAHDVAMRHGGGWQATLWVVDGPDVMTRLRRAGVGDLREHPGHYVVEAAEVGIGSAPIMGVTSWMWPSALL